MKKLTKIISAALSALTLMTATAYAEEEIKKSDTAGFAREEELVLPVKTANSSDAEILWKTEEAENAGVILSYDKFVIQPAGNKIKKISESKGEVEFTLELNEKVDTEHRGAISVDTLLQPARTRLFAVNLRSMETIGSKVFGEFLTDVAVIGNNVYFGVKTDERTAFMCVDFTKDFETVWEYETNEEMTSPTIFGNYIVFGTGDKLVCHEKTGSGYSENPVGAKIKSVYAAQYAVFMTAHDGKLYKARIADGGKFEDDTLLSCELGGNLCDPIEISNRLFITSDTYFYAVDGLNMEVSKRIPYLKNSKLLYITYGSGIRIYLTKKIEEEGYEGKYNLYEVNPTDTDITFSGIATISDFSEGKVAISANGTMYFQDNLGQVWALVVPDANAFAMVLKIILMVAIVVMVFLVLRAWTKKRGSKTPRFLQ